MLVFRGNKKGEKDIEIIHIDSVAMISKGPVGTSKFKKVREANWLSGNFIRLKEDRLEK